MNGSPLSLNITHHSTPLESSRHTLATSVPVPEKSYFSGFLSSEQYQEAYYDRSRPWEGQLAETLDGTCTNRRKEDTYATATVPYR